MKHLLAKEACREFLGSLSHMVPTEHIDQVLEHLDNYIDLILKHAERRQLIAESQRGPEALWVHAFDSLQILAVSSPTEWLELWDAGSGNGFPGVPVAAAVPSAKIRLIDRSLKKAEFLELAVATLSLRGATVHCQELSRAMAESDITPVIAARALVKPEQWRGVLKSITSRAHWIIFATKANADQWEQIAEEFSYTIKSIHSYTLPGTNTTRCLLNFGAS